MDILTKAHKKFLIDLLDANVSFLLIGGYAVNFHGYARYTSDMDLWLKPDEINKNNFIEFLRRRNFNAESLEHLQQLDFTIANAFHIGQAETKIDFLTKVVGVKYDEANEQKVFLPLGNRQIPVIQYHHLILSKMSTSRIQDIADVEQLQNINKFKKK